MIQVAYEYSSCLKCGNVARRSTQKERSGVQAVTSPANLMVKRREGVF